MFFANARGAGTLLTIPTALPCGTHLVSNARGLPGGMLAAGIDSHINGKSFFRIFLLRSSIQYSPLIGLSRTRLTRTLFYLKRNPVSLRFDPYFSPLLFTTAYLEVAYLESRLSRTIQFAFVMSRYVPKIKEFLCISSWSGPG